MQITLSIIIPVFNEFRTVRELLDLVWNVELGPIRKELIIVESNSTDGSREFVKAFADKKNLGNPGSVKVLLEAVPGGKGRAVRAGLAAASGDIVLIQDADLEYDVQDYKALIQPIVDGKSTFVLGSRHLSSGSWKIRKFGKRGVSSQILNIGGVFFHWLFNFTFGTKLSDPTTMYKVFKRSCLENFELVSDRFDFDYELLGKLIRSGAVPIELPVQYNSRGFAEGKKVRMFRDPLTWVWAIFKFRFCKMKSKDGHPVVRVQEYGDIAEALK